MFKFTSGERILQLKLDCPFGMDTFTASVCMPPKLNLFADKEDIGKTLVFSVKSLRISQLPMFKSTSGERVLQLKLERHFDMDTFTASVCMPPKLNLFADKEEIGKALVFPSNHSAFVNFRC